jgi:primosomal protein N'
MYISVIPLRHSLSKRPYIYFVADVWREAIIVWGLVEVPIGRHMTEAIIVEKSEYPPEDIAIEDIRAIIRVTASVEIIAPYMIGMILAIADRYFLLIHKVASMFAPAPLLSRLDKKNYILDHQAGKTPNSKLPTTEIHHYIDSIFSSQNLEKYLIPWSVLVFPDDILLRFFESAVPENMRERIGIFPTDLTQAKRVRSWIETYEGKYDIIFWTRRILYYNLSCYDRIIYIEDAFATEQYSYPIRIQNLDILRALSNEKRHDIILISSTPSLMTLSYFQWADIISIRT